MAEFHFIDDPQTLEIIQEILDLAGPNFSPPYDGTSQPADAEERNRDVLVQYQTPGGGEFSGAAEPAGSPDMGTVINTLLMILSPFISAYGLILPILGIIRGILEILCCLMNPFCVIPAVIRLFVKWLPPFISIFPPFAGAVIIASTIKLIIAIVFYIMTEIVPTIQLIIKNVEKIVDGFFSVPRSEAAIDAGKTKLRAIVTDLKNRIGLLGVLKPILEIIFLILALVAGFPCAGGTVSDCSRPDITGVSTDFSCDEPDSPVECPAVLETSTPIKGRALLTPAFFGDSIPFFSYLALPIDAAGLRVPEIVPFMQSLNEQLNAQLDEAIDEALPYGGNNISAHFLLKITGPRGPFLERSAPIVRIFGTAMQVIDPLLLTMTGLVDYEVVPNFPMLIARNVVGVACHPDVKVVIAQLNARVGDLEQSALDKNPEIRPIESLYNEMVDDMGDLNNTLSGFVEDVATNDPDPDFNTEIAGIQKVQDDMIELLTNLSEDMKERMNALVSRSSDRINSDFDVDKRLVRAGGEDKAIVTITPKDFGGSKTGKNLPSGVDISVDIFTDFGVLANQQRTNSTGDVTAELTSTFPGVATLTAKVNQEFISTFSGTSEETKEIQVRFVADSTLPKRRLVTKTGVNSKASTATSSEREPGGK